MAMIAIWIIAGALLTIALAFVGVIALIASVNSFGDSGALD
ncbi:hypothetical protein [Bradyrhizobium sp. 23]|nr:hypothetical protein [Bradyrhizobium sp. 23]